MAKDKKTKKQEKPAQEEKKDTSDITLDELRNSPIGVTLPSDLTRLGPRKNGGVWFKNTKTGHYLGFVRNEESGEPELVETTETSKQTTSVKKPARVTIKCACGNEREIASQDAFQVTRCVTCQKKYRNAKRAERMKARRANARKQRELEKLNSNIDQK